MTTTIETKAAVTEIKYVSEALTALVQCFAKLKSNNSVSLPTDSLYPILKKTIRDLEKVLEIPAQDSYIKVIFNKGNFEGMKTAELALVNTVPSIVINSKVFDATAFLAKGDILQYACAGTLKDKTLQYYLKATDKKNAQTSALPIKCWFAPDNELETFKLVDDIEYLKKNLLEYIFGLDTLKDGVYDVTKWTKINNKFYVVTIAGTQYYSKEKHIKQLTEQKEAEKPTRIVLDGIRDLKLKDTGEVIKYRNVYVEGFAPGTYLKDLVGQFLTLPNEEELKEKKNIVFDEPLAINVKGTEKTMTDKGASFVIKCEVKGKELYLSPNKALSDAYAVGKFNVSSFENFHIDVIGVSYYNGYSFKLDWHIPQSSITFDDTLSNLTKALGLVA